MRWLVSEGTFVQDVAEDAKGEDCDGEDVAAIFWVSAGQFGDGFVVIFFMESWIRYRFWFLAFVPLPCLAAMLKVCKLLVFYFMGYRCYVLPEDWVECNGSCCNYWSVIIIIPVCSAWFSYLRSSSGRN